jgi:hypothetical protein
VADDGGDGLSGASAFEGGSVMARTVLRFTLKAALFVIGITGLPVGVVMVVWS